MRLVVWRHIFLGMLLRLILFQLLWTCWSTVPSGGGPADPGLCDHHPMGPCTGGTRVFDCHADNEWLAAFAIFTWLLYFAFNAIFLNEFGFTNEEGSPRIAFFPLFFVTWGLSICGAWMHGRPEVLRPEELEKEEEAHGEGVQENGPPETIGAQRYCRVSLAM